MRSRFFVFARAPRRRAGSGAKTSRPAVRRAPVGFSSWLGAACALALAVPGPAQMKRFESEKGFSFRYPREWIIASQRLRERALEELGSSGAFLATLDHSDLEVCVFSPVRDGFAENVQVRITNTRLTDADLRDPEAYREAVMEELHALRVEPRDVRVEELRVDERAALAVEWTYTMPRAERDVRARRIAVPGNAHTYLFTLSAAATEFEDLQPTFDAIVGTIRVDDGWVGRWYAMTPLTRQVIGVGGAAMVVGLLWWISRRMRPVSRLADRRMLPFDPVREGDFKGLS